MPPRSPACCSPSEAWLTYSASVHAAQGWRLPSRPLVVSRTQVLLSTYNGAAHLAELLESILAQDGGAPDVLVRDDGSTDRTRAILEEYERRGAIRWVAGENVGAVRSFFWLLAHAAADAEIVALADQDDVWLPGKLARARAALAGVPAAEPALYCSTLTLVDDELRVIGRTSPPRRGPSFGNALVENVVTGCTAALNAAALRAVRRELPRQAHMHDWWLYQVVAGVGTVIVDAESHILYRQHAGNVVGAPRSRLASAVRRVRRVGRRRRAMLPPDQLRELERIHGPSLAPADRELLRRISAPRSRRDRLAAALSSDVVCQARWKTVAVRWLLAFGAA